MNRITAVTVLYNNSGLLPALAKTLSRLRIPVVIYDSGSTDGSGKAAETGVPGATVIHGENRGFGWGCNAGADLVETEYILFLNSDASIEPEDLSLLEEHLKSDSGVAGAQPLIRAWNWPLVTAGRGVFVTPFGEAWDAGFMHLEPEPCRTVLRTPGVSAAVSLWRTRAFRALEGFDPGFFMYFEDADLCLRASVQGWRFSVIMEARARHRIGSSSPRSRASLWELASSVRLARRFLGGGRLPRGFLARETRIQLRLLLSGKPWLPRQRILLRSMAKPVDPVILPERVRTGLHGLPEDMPLPRPGPRGPGMQGRYLAPYGVFPSDGREMVLYSPFRQVTGGVCHDHGETAERFMIPKGERITLRLPSGGGLSYIFCDCPGARVEVALADSI